MKHTGYLTLVRELTRAACGGVVDITEAHGGKGIYASAHPHLLAARQASGYSLSTLGVAQDACFDSVTGVGPVRDMQPGTIAYAGSAALHAQLVRDRSVSSLTLVDNNPEVRVVADRVFSQPCFSTVRSVLRTEDPVGASEPKLLLDLRNGVLGGTHVLHFDPFAFVMAKDDIGTRASYREILRECDARVGAGRLAATSLFFTWGSHGAAAKEDLFGGGYAGGLPGGYQELVSSVAASQRIVVSWCWELYFSILFIVPDTLRPKLARALKADLAWLAPLMSHVSIR